MPHRTASILFALALAYATVRYNVFKGVPWAEWPAFVVNKAVALAALGMFAVVAVRRHRGLADGPGLARAARGFLAVHVLLSLVLLGPVTFPAYFADGKPTAPAAASLALGAVGVALANAGVHLAFVAFLAGAHAALLGFAGWWDPSAWPGGMPPITLISFVLGVLSLGAGRSSRRK